MYTLTITREFGETTVVATSLDSEHDFNPVQGSVYVPGPNFEGQDSKIKIPIFKFGVFLHSSTQPLQPNGYPQTTVTFFHTSYVIPPEPASPPATFGQRRPLNDRYVCFPGSL